MEGRGRERGKGRKKEIKMPCVCAPTACTEQKHHALLEFIMTLKVLFLKK